MTIRPNPLATVAKELQTTIGRSGTARLSPLAQAIGCDVYRATRTAWRRSHNAGQPRYWRESMRHEQEVRVMPYARCSECGDAMQVEKVSNDIIMMWHGAH